MAEKSGLSYIPGTEASQEYDEAMRMLRESLSARQKPLFDPTFMALAAGASKPTRTGGYGEMLGNVAESLMTEQERARTQQQQDIASRMELAKFGMNIEQQRQRGKAFEGLLGAGAPPSAQPNGGLPTAPVSARPPGARPEDGGALPARPDVSTAAPPTNVVQEKPPGFEDVEGIQIQPPNPAFVDRLTYLRLAQADPSISPAKAVEMAQELEKKRYETKEGGVIDLAKGIFYPFPKGELVKRQLFGMGEGKTYEVDQRTATLLDKYAATDDPKYEKLVQRIVGGPKAEPGKEKKEVRLPSVEAREAEKFATQKAEEGKYGKREPVFIYEIGKEIPLSPTKAVEYEKARSEGKGREWISKNIPEAKISGGDVGGALPKSEAEKAGEIETAKLEAQTAAEKKKQVISMGDSAKDRILLSKQLNSFATDPRKARVMALLEKATPESALGKLLSEGISVGSFRVGIPQLREAVLAAGGNDNDVSNFQQLGNIYTQLMFLNGNLFQGQGAVSNYEREMQVRMAGSVQDTPKVAEARANYIMTRANFDRAVSRSFQDWLDNNKGGTFDQYKRKSKDYDTLEDAYINRVEKLANKFFPDIAGGTKSEAKGESKSDGWRGQLKGK